MTNKEFDKAKFEREMEKEYSKKDIMIKGKRADFEKSSIKNHSLYELMYGDKLKRTQNHLGEIWENLRRYN